MIWSRAEHAEPRGYGGKTDLYVAGVGSSPPVMSVARTMMVWLPSPMSVTLKIAGAFTSFRPFGRCTAPPSSLYAKLNCVSELETENVAVRSLESSWGQRKSVSNRPLC